jgi:hypothetical protein
MHKNLGVEDRFIRLLVGVSLIMNIPTLQPGLVFSILLAVAGVALIATTFVGFCCLYKPIKLDTRDKYAKNVAE